MQDLVQKIGKIFSTEGVNRLVWKLVTQFLPSEGVGWSIENWYKFATE